MSKHLELTGEKNSENMLTLLVLKSLLSEYDYFKTVHDFSKEKVYFAEVKKALKIFECSRNLKTATTSNENVALLSRGTPAKNSSRKHEKFTGECRRCFESGRKQATCRVSQCNFCRRLAMKGIYFQEKPSIEPYFKC